jgi:hypothetical protein
MRRVRTTDVGEIANDVLADINTLRAHILATGNDAVKEAWAGMETFSAISLRLMAKSNPSKVRDIARTVEIQSYL